MGRILADLHVQADPALVAATLADGDVISHGKRVRPRDSPDAAPASFASSVIWAHMRSAGAAALKWECHGDRKRIVTCAAEWWTLSLMSVRHEMGTHMAFEG